MEGQEERDGAGFQKRLEKSILEEEKGEGKTGEEWKEQREQEKVKS